MEHLSQDICNKSRSKTQIVAENVIGCRKDIYLRYLNSCHYRSICTPPKLECNLLQ